MEYNEFEKPVRILMGLGIPRDITTAFDAYTFLSELRSDPRDTDQAVARKTCLAAINRMVDAEIARAAFVRYAERNDLLAPEFDGMLAARQSSNSGNRFSA